MNKRFLVFVGETHYPNGGFDDYVGSSNFVDAARDLAIKTFTTRYSYSECWAHIFDSKTFQIVLRLKYRRKKHPISGEDMNEFCVPPLSLEYEAE